jgi:hypothetical protein
MDKLKFKCHCGKVSLQVSELPEHFLQCNCSTCGRYGAKWAYYKKSEVEKSFSSKDVAGYVWGDKESEFFHCVSCGCMTHYETTELADKQKIALNGRMLLDREHMDTIPSKYFDGRHTWKFVEKAF